MRITSKGRITIPIRVRNRLGLLPNTEVELEVVGDTVWLRKGKGQPRHGRSLAAHLRGRASTAMTTDQVLALTRG